MNMIRSAGRCASRWLGNDSAVIRRARPLYNWVLDVLSGGKGTWQVFNGHERFRIDPHQRHHFPENKDPAVCAFLREHVRPGHVCLNVGAHVGLYALCLARWSAPGGKVVAFEPNPTTRDILTRHLHLNGAQQCVEVKPVAVSECAGEAEFCADGAEGVSRLGEPNPVVQTGALSRIRVPVVRLDDVCSNDGLVPDWITVDVEGYEAGVLAGARGTIEAHRGRVRLLVEMHPALWASAGSSRERMQHLIADLGLEMRPLEGQTDPLGQHGIVLLNSSSPNGAGSLR